VFRSRVAESVAVIGLLLLTGCTSQTAETQVAPRSEWTENVLDIEIFPGATFAFSPDGKWLATNDRQVCIQSLEIAARRSCIEEPTMGRDSLRWSSDSSAVTTGGSLSGSWRASGVWVVKPDGTAAAISPVEEGNIIRGPTDWNAMMAFRPDGESLVFVQVRQNEEFQIAEIDVDGENLVTLTELTSMGDLSGFPLVPLDDERIVLNVGAVESSIQLLEDGQLTEILSAPSDEVGSPAALEATAAEGGLALVTFPRLLTSTRGLPLQSRWSLVDFDGAEFPLPISSDQRIVSATFSPDGGDVAYISLELENPTPFGQVTVASVKDVLAGESETASRRLVSDVMWLGPTNSTDLRTMTWTDDNRLLLANPRAREASVIEIDIAG